jgi:hypothetical protein
VGNFLWHTILTYAPRLDLQFQNVSFQVSGSLHHSRRSVCLALPRETEFGDIDLVAFDSYATSDVNE